VTDAREEDGQGRGGADSEEEGRSPAHDERHDEEPQGEPSAERRHRVVVRDEALASNVPALSFEACLFDGAGERLHIAQWPRPSHPLPAFQEVYGEHASFFALRDKPNGVDSLPSDGDAPSAEVKD
jgi:hypothetical protein